MVNYIESETAKDGYFYALSKVGDDRKIVYSIHIKNKKINYEKICIISYRRRTLS